MRAARVHHAGRRRGSGVAARGAGAAAERMRRDRRAHRHAADRSEARAAHRPHFQKGLQALGWTDGRNLRIDYRWAATSDLDRLQSAALELVASDPELIVVWSDPAVSAMRADDRIHPDRIRVGRRSGRRRLRRKPGASGRQSHRLYGLRAGVGGKWLEHLKEIAPALTRVVCSCTRTSRRTAEFYRAAQAAGTALESMSTQSTCVSAADIQRAVSALAARSPTAASSCCRIRWRQSSRPDHRAGGAPPPTGYLSVPLLRPSTAA